MNMNRILALEIANPRPSGPTSLENHFVKNTQETAEPFKFSLAEPVDYY